MPDQKVRNGEECIKCGNRDLRLSPEVEEGEWVFGDGPFWGLDWCEKYRQCKGYYALNFIHCDNCKIIDGARCPTCNSFIKGWEHPVLEGEGSCLNTFIFLLILCSLFGLLIYWRM